MPPTYKIINKIKDGYKLGILFDNEPELNAPSEIEPFMLCNDKTKEGVAFWSLTPKIIKLIINSRLNTKQLDILDIYKNKDIIISKQSANITNQKGII